jgi:hypothetical protein
VRVLQQLVRKPGADGAGSAAAWSDLGDSLGDALQFNDAIHGGPFSSKFAHFILSSLTVAVAAAYSRALQLRNDLVSAQYSRLHYLLHLCDWDGIANLQPHWNSTLQVVF